MQYFREFGFKTRLLGVFLASEGVTVDEIKEISSFFNCKVLLFYGQSERALFAADFDSTGIYRVFTSYGMPRIVNGDLVVTSFVNRALPLVNYNTGDGAELFEDEKYLFIRNVTSRWGKDFVYLNNSKKISTTAINLHSLIQKEILFYQIHQNNFGKVDILVLPKKDSNISNENLIEAIKNELQVKLLNFQLDVRIAHDKEIIRSKRGKMIMLVQNLDL
jgi:phenylacetate-coenzyme A ligase PaaK-like adenylate-forming protein